MNNPAEIKRTAQHYILQPFQLKNATSATTRKIAGGILAAFFVLLGIGILMSGFKAEENQIAYYAGGLVFLAFPAFVIFLVYKTNQKIIKEVNHEGVLVSSGKLYNWETLKSITYHTTVSQYNTDELNHIYLIDFHFADGNARSTYAYSNFKNIEYLSDKLQVTKNIKKNAYHR